MGCSQSKKELKTGIYRATIAIQGMELPFNFDLQQSGDGAYKAYIHNAEERILIDEIQVAGDSLHMTLHIFDAAFEAVIEGEKLKGQFVINYADDYKLPFEAVPGQSHRFVVSDTAANVKDFSGTYDVDFFNETNTVRAVGIVNQKGNYATGSFLTPTGDYRYLEGNVVGDTLWLSAFDGNHLFIFSAAKTSDNTLEGTQWLGRTRFRRWTATRNEDAKPPESESLMFLKEGYERLDFSFPDADGVVVNSTDAQYENKVVIVQILGSWCPNCLDETRFLVEWYKKNKERGVEIIGLAYEQRADFTYASGRVRKMVEKLKIPYRVLVAGVSDNAKASETLPALNKVVAFPSTIFIGKDGKVKNIHAGFTGPGTGIYYEQMKEQFNQKVNAYLLEK
jgi:thiol-disulfide isomerase/thioredoxin